MGFPKKRDTDTETPPVTEETPAKEAPARRGTWSPYDEGPRSRGPLWFTLGGLGVLGALVAGLVVMWNTKGPDPTAAPTDRPTSAVLPEAPGGKFGYAAERGTDPDRLTLKELFPGKKVAVGGRTYELTAKASDKKCADGAVGGKLLKALKSGKCTQVLRVSFRDKKGEVIGTIGVVNLSTTKAAEKVVAAKGKGKAENYVKALPGKDTVTKFLGSGEAGVSFAAHGHYAILSWVQFKDGHKPDKKGSKQLTQARDDVIGKTVYPTLEARSLSGRPRV